MPDATSSAVALLDRIEAADKAYREAKSDLTAVLTRVAERLLPVGAEIDLRRGRALPEHLIQVRTIRGNDRKSWVFQVASPPRVTVDAPHYDMASWTCQAIPISEKTGKPMSGATHGADSRDTVTITGHFLNPHLDESLDKARERFLRLLASGATAVDSSDAAPTPRKAKP